ncbi:MAG: tetratricopeptide repeat protein [Candidatus Eisenbacteria bacterium]|nr:tetratricopeptide repeat protein [Candidatus Eisenbacteria bacterium]
MREVLAAAAERLDRDSNTDGRFAKEPLVEASIRTAIGRTYRKLGEYQPAEPHLRRALALRRSVLGPEHPQTWWAMHELGLLEYDMSRLAQAESLLVGVYERSRLHLGPENADVLSVEMRVANLYRKQGRFKEAEPIYVHNLDARRRSYGDESASTLDAAVALANLYQETGRYEQAEPLHRQVMETYRRTLGETDLATVTATTNLANDLALLGRFEDAEPLMKLVLDQKVELYGPDHPTTAQQREQSRGTERSARAGRRGRGVPPPGARRTHPCARGAACAHPTVAEVPGGQPGQPEALCRGRALGRRRRPERHPGPR